MIHRWEYGEKFTVGEAYRDRKEYVEAMLKTITKKDWLSDAKWTDVVMATRICRKCGKKMVGWVGIGLYCFGLKDYACSWTEVEPDKQEKRDIRLKQLGIR
jgi:hypothetical protein